MNYILSGLIGMVVIALVLSAGAVGYGLAHVRAWRAPVIAACCALTLAYGGVGALLTSVVYTRLTQPVRTTAVQTSPTSAPQSSPPAVADQQPQPPPDAWLRFQSDSQDYIVPRNNQPSPLYASTSTITPARPNTPC